MSRATPEKQPWPELSYRDWKETLRTVHLWTQIVGKIRLANMPWINHSWHVTLYISPEGLTTGAIPYKGGIFRIDFDFLAHQVHISSSWAGKEKLKLYPRTVADFYKELTEKLAGIGVDTAIYAAPNEIDPAVPFEQDTSHQSYDSDQMSRFWNVLVKVYGVFTRFRAGFRGKCSPVHFFWGGFDLAVTRFSGREAPVHQGEIPNMPKKVMQEAYSHEVSSCGFWPGNDQYPQAAFYSYCYPSAPEFGKQAVSPAKAFFSEDMGEFLLNYETVRQSDDPEGELMQFLQSTYEAAADTGKWDRETLECNLTSFEK